MTRYHKHPERHALQLLGIKQLSHCFSALLDFNIDFVLFRFCVGGWE